MFLHGGWMHLIGNMWFLWVFGNNIEDSMGHARFVAFYLLTGLLASAAHVLTARASVVPTVGASGAISGIMGAYIVLYPRVRVLTAIFLVYFARIVALPAVAVLGLWFALQLLQGTAALGGPAGGGGVAFWAHIGGFVAGAGLIKLFARRKLVRAKREGHVLTRDELGPWERW
jgi:membrane associated rhomboid family serine protease